VIDEMKVDAARHDVANLHRPHLQEIGAVVGFASPRLVIAWLSMNI